MEKPKSKSEVQNVETSKKRVLTGMFRDHESTEKACNSLNNIGYSENEINLLMSYETRKAHYNKDANKKTKIGIKAAQNAEEGSAIGILIGSGIPEARAKLYESGIKEGNVVISVTPKNDRDAKFLENNWKTNQGEEIHW
jgi:hypothetical protein